MQTVAHAIAGLVVLGLAALSAVVIGVEFGASIGWSAIAAISLVGAIAGRKAREEFSPRAVPVRIRER